MDIDSLRLIILLSRTLNFTKASSESFMTQPTLSRKIVQCEEELGIKIFNRSTHSVSLTEAGREVIDDIQRIVSLYDELSRYCHSLDKEKPLKIGYSVYPYGLSFCMKVEEFLKKNGDNIASSIDFIPLEESVKALADGNIDGLVTIDFLKENDGMAHTRIEPSRVYAVVNCRNPLSEKNNLTVSDLKGNRIILSGREICNELYESRMAFLIKNGISRDLIIDAESAKDAMMMASRDEGIPILNEEGHINTIDTLRPIPLIGDIPEIDFIFAWMERNKSKSLTRYIDAVKAVAATEDR